MASRIKDLGCKTLALCGLLYALAGCHSQTAVAPPNTEDAEAALLVVVEAQETRIYGVELGDPPLWPDLAVAPGAQMHVLMFSCGLARLGLRPGQINLEPSVQPHELPSALRQTKLQLPEGDWVQTNEPTAAVADALSRLPLNGASVCADRAAQLEKVQAGLPQDGHNLAAYVTALQDGTALVASKEGYFYRVWPDGRVRSITPPPVPGEPRAAHVTDDGTVYLLNSQGELHSGNLDDGFSLISSSPLFDGADSVNLTGPTDPSATFELFAATTQRALLHFDGQQWTKTATATGTSTSASTDWTVRPPPPVVWMGPGTAAAAYYGPDIRSIVIHSPEGTEVLAPPSPDITPMGLGWSPGRGLLVGTIRGPVFQLQAGTGEWTRLPGSPQPRGFSRPIEALQSDALLIGQAISFGGRDFGFGQWLPEIGFCLPSVFTPLVLSMAKIDETTWVLNTATSLSANQAFDIAIIRQTAPPATCSGL